MHGAPKAIRWSIVTLIALLTSSCGTAAGGGDGAPTGSTPTATAVGAACVATVHEEACLAGGNHRVRCDAQAGAWQLIELCPEGTFCVATVIDASTGKSTSACNKPAPDTSGDEGSKEARSGVSA